MKNNISWSREGKDQQSDQPQTRDVSRSNGKPLNVIRQQATLNDLQQRGVGGQAHELEQVGKGKMLALTDGKDEKSTRGKSHPTEKILLSGKGLLGGGSNFSRTIVSDVRSSERQIGRNLSPLGKMLYDRHQRKIADEEEFYARLDELEMRHRKVRKHIFDDFNREVPDHDADDRLFNQLKKSLLEDDDGEINRCGDEVRKAGMI